MIWRTCAVIHEVEVLDTWRIEARIVGRCLPEIRKSGGSAEIVGADLSPNGPATSAERKHGPGQGIFGTVLRPEEEAAFDLHYEHTLIFVLTYMSISSYSSYRDEDCQRWWSKG